MRAVGDGISSLVANAFDTIGNVLRGAVGQVEAVVPGPLLIVIVIGGLIALGWNLAKR